MTYTQTQGTKNTLKNSEQNSIQKFWELNKIAKTQKAENQVRTHLAMKNLAIEAINNDEIDETNKFYNYVDAFADGEVVKNSYGKLLYFKKG